MSVPAVKRIHPTPTLRAIMACAAIVLLSACQRSPEEEIAEVRPVRVTVIEDRASGGRVSLTGSVQAQTEINLTFRIGGRLVERMVDIGDNVTSGALIARLDPNWKYQKF